MPSISTDEIIALLEQGLSQAEVSRIYGCSRQYIHKLIKQAGYTQAFTAQTQLIRDNFPWEIEDPEVYGNTVYIQLWLMARFNDDPTSISEESVKRVKALVRKLVNFSQVVDYNPEYPWVKGLFNTYGLAFLPRGEADHDLAIKNRPGVKITHEGERLWKIPDLKKLRL